MTVLPEIGYECPVCGERVSRNVYIFKTKEGCMHVEFEEYEYIKAKDILKMHKEIIESIVRFEKHYCDPTFTLSSAPLREYIDKMDEELETFVKKYEAKDGLEEEVE